MLRIRLCLPLFKYFHAELWLSYRYFLLVLADAGLVFTFMAEAISDPLQRLIFQDIGVSIYAALAVVWILDRFHHDMRAVATTVIIAIVVIGGTSLFGGGVCAAHSLVL